MLNVHVENTCSKYLRGGGSQVKGSEILMNPTSSWGHVGTIFRSWAFFGALAAFVVSRGRFLDVLERSGLDFERSREAPGRLQGGNVPVAGPPTPFGQRPRELLSCVLIFGGLCGPLF